MRDPATINGLLLQFPSVGTKGRRKSDQHSMSRVRTFLSSA